MMAGCFSCNRAQIRFLCQLMFLVGLIFSENAASDGRDAITVEVSEHLLVCESIGRYAGNVARWYQKGASYRFVILDIHNVASSEGLSSEHIETLQTVATEVYKHPDLYPAIHEEYWEEACLSTVYGSELFGGIKKHKRLLLFCQRIPDASMQAFCLRRVLHKDRTRLGTPEGMNSLFFSDSLAVDLNNPKSYIERLELGYEQMFPLVDLVLLAPHDVIPFDDQSQGVASFLATYQLQGYSSIKGINSTIAALREQSTKGLGAALLVRHINKNASQYGLDLLGTKYLCVIVPPRVDVSTWYSARNGVSLEHYANFIYNHEAFHCFTAAIKFAMEERSGDARYTYKNENWADVFAGIMHLLQTGGDKSFLTWLASDRDDDKEEDPLHHSTQAIEALLALDYKKDIHGKSMHELAILAYAITSRNITNNTQY